MVAVSVYIRLLREASGLSQEQAAANAKISAKTLGRWEKGETDHEPGVTKLKQLVRVIGGSPKDALQLLIHDGATQEDGEVAAQTKIGGLRGATVNATTDCNAAMDKLISGIDTNSAVDLRKAIVLMNSCGQKIRAILPEIQALQDS